MTQNRIIKTAMVLFAVLFLSAQGISQAHATANGGTDHSHDGVACSVALIAAQHAVVEPEVTVVIPDPQPAILSDYAPANQTTCIGFTSRAPPPRGPPSHI